MLIAPVYTLIKGSYRTAVPEFTLNFKEIDNATNELQN